MILLNKTRNPIYAPVLPGDTVSDKHLILPGEFMAIDADAHKKAMAIRGGAYKALIEQGMLIVSFSEKDKKKSKKKSAETKAGDGELMVPTNPEKPADLDENPSTAGVDGDIEAKRESEFAGFQSPPKFA